jgi:hypothetical protein
MAFNEEINIAVFTTRFVVQNASPIVYVSHDEEGDWQFLGSEQVSMKDAMVVSLEDIITIDKTILELANLPIGDSASRSSKESKWEIITNKESV